MHKKYIAILLTLSLITTSCATLNDSMTLGAGMGAATGAAATFTAHTSINGEAPSFSSVALGAGIGTAVGLLTSFFVHKKVEEDRLTYQSELDMHFGDLPPSPFIVPKKLPKKGGE